MYWRYYCAEKNGDVKVAKETRDRLMREHPLSFQNLAVNGDESEFTNQVLKTTMPSVALRSVIRPDMNTTLRAAEALSKAGSPHLAAEMLDHSAADIATLEPEVRLYVASFLHNAGAPLEEFRVLSMLFQDSPRMMTKAAAKMYFPLAYIDIVQNKQKHIDPLLILSLIRQESAFNRLARSSVGARGLMQVMPATARAVASVRAANLYIPEINVSVGSKYFAHQLTSFEGDVEYTLAAYNAGVNRVENWRKRYPTENKRLFLDLIPFRETRDYVTSILRNYFWYVRIYSDEITPSRVAAAAQATTGDVAGQLRLKTQAIMAANAGPVALSLERTAVRK
jgi:soluble lytic murein transglycosylase